MTETKQPAGRSAVQVRGIAKYYGETKALDGVDLDIAEGTVRGLLGPNGAGKTTLVRVLSTLIKPDAGTAVVAGYDVVRQPRQLRKAIGLTGQYASVDELLSGYENLYLIGRLLDLSSKGAKARANEMLERFSLTDAAKRPARTYSGGMRRRLDLAASMIGRPRVLYLDEPTTGLDPRTRNEVWAEVQAMVGDGATVLLTTQYMEEAEVLAQDLTVIDRGRVIADGTVDSLKRQVGTQKLTIRPARPDDLDAMVRTLAAFGAYTERGGLGEPGQVAVPTADEERLTAVIGTLASAGLPVASISTSMPSLDEVFLTITGQLPTNGAEMPEQRAAVALEEAAR